MMELYRKMAQKLSKVLKKKPVDLGFMIASNIQDTSTGVSILSLFTIASIKIHFLQMHTIKLQPTVSRLAEVDEQ